MKICPRCKNNTRDGNLAYCKQCKTEKQREYNKKYRSTQAGKEKMYTLSKKWKRDQRGFTQDYIDFTFKEQNFSCGICKTKNASKNKINDWHTDHNHITNTPRGILCAGCNTLLGRLESVGFDWIINAKEYLRKYEK